jgi:hypothetical protein
MDNVFVLAGIIAIVFFLIKFIEMRFIQKEAKPIKGILIDSIIVFIASVLGIYLMEQFGIARALSENKDSPQAFVSNPDF